MKQTYKALFFLGLLLFSITDAKSSSNKAHVEYTQQETLWTQRFAHCDYGFFILLPDGMVAHSTLPPNPIHGFTVALPEIGRRKEVTVERDRFIWTNAEYNASDAGTPKQATDSYIDLVGAGKPGRTVQKHKAKLDTLPATRVRVEYDAPEGRMVEEKVIALRGNIVYVIGLRTNLRDYENDKREYERVLAGFRVWRIHYC